jgi:tRNA (Thr-GGU) A37 N-methylase
MGTVQTYELRPIGWVRSPLTDRGAAPKQGDEGAPPARILVRPELAEATADLTVGATVIVLTWLHDRPNPIGLHVVTIADIDGTTLDVHDLEAIDGTPVIDIKPVLGSER